MTRAFFYYLCCMQRGIFFECCCQSVHDALEAQAGGAQRIELCSRLEVGGVSPSTQLISEVLGAVSIPVNVLVRPREGNFCWTPGEAEEILENIFIMDEAERKERGIESEWLFPNSSGSDHIGIPTINSWMNILSRISGLDIYAHSFRHYFTTMLSNEGLPDNVIKEIVQWNDISMVGVYVDRSAEDTLDMYFGSDGIIRKEAKAISDL